MSKEQGELKAAIERVEAFLAHVEGHPGSLIFARGKTLRPADLRSMIEASPSGEGGEDVARITRDLQLRCTEVWPREDGTVWAFTEQDLREALVKSLPVVGGEGGSGSSCTDLGSEEPDGSFASEGSSQTEGGR